MSSDPFADVLAAFDPEVARGCAAHWALVKKWQKTINLTAIEDDAEAATLHYLDSLVLLEHWGPGQSLVDLGSGAGFPGIPLAIARPNSEVLLVEPRRKRASFLRTAKARLSLPDVSVLEARSEDEPPRLFDLAVTRATFSQDADLRACLRWLRAGGRLLAMRGPVAAAQQPVDGVRQVRYRLGAADRILEIYGL